MEKIFEKQMGSKTPLTEERLNSLSFKTTHLGNELNVGDYLHFAFLNINTDVELNRKNLQIIALTDKEFDKYESEGDQPTSLPTLKLKNI